MSNEYTLLDSGFGRKLERFGPYTMARPCSQAIWASKLSSDEWDQLTDASFTREGGNQWQGKKRLPDQWTIQVSGLTFQLSSTDFGHLGIFPEQRLFWEWLQKRCRRSAGQKPLSVLNLFAYSGGSTLACAKAGAEVCHLDASKGMVAWARENARLNSLEQAPIRWITDDVTKFLRREQRRGRRYDGIILDPPTFGRGSQGELFKIEEHLIEILDLCQSLLSENPNFILLSCHTPGVTPISLTHLLHPVKAAYQGSIDAGEMLLTGQEDVFSIPCGSYARWTYGA